MTRHGNQIKARIIAPGASLPITDEAERILHKKGVLCLPDFITNAGGLIGGLSDRVGVDIDRALTNVRTLIRKATLDLLRQASEQRQPPRDVALQIAKKRVNEAMLSSRRWSLASTEQRLREMLAD